MSNLPIISSAGDLQVVDPDTGEALPIREASPRARMAAAEALAQHAREVGQARSLLALTMRDDFGVGTARVGGFKFKVAESTSWPRGPTRTALDRLVESGAITRAEADRAMPMQPTPDGTQLKALAGRLAVKDPDAARILAGACTISPPSLRDIEREPEGSVVE